MSMDSKTLFTKVSPVKLFFSAAIPGMISMFASSLYTILEGVFIGHYLGGTSFAAISLAIPFVLINFSLADLIGVGSSVPISISLGQKDEEKANNIFTCSIIMIFTTAIIIGILMYWASPLLIRLMGAEGEMAELAVQYIRAYATCGPLCTIVFAMDNYLRICGYIRGSMFLNIFMSLLTIVLLFFFIIVLRIGLVGSALAACSSMFVCALIALYPFIRKKTLLRFSKPHFTVSMVKEIVTCGLPAFFSNIAGRLTSIVINIALLKLGGPVAVGAYGVVMYASDMIQPFLYGMSDSLQPAIGYNWGAKSFDRVKVIVKCVYIASAVVSFVATAIMFFFSKSIAKLFVDATDTELLIMSSSALKLFCLAYLVLWFGFATQSFYSAIEKPLPAVILSITSAMLFPILIIVVLWPLELTGLWLNMVLTSVLVAILALIMLLKTQKKMRQQCEGVAE